MQYVGGNNMNSRIRNDDSGVATVIETMIAMTITITIFSLFIFSTSNMYTIHTDRPDIDLDAKCLDICEKLINSPGMDSNHNLNWEDYPDNMTVLGLGATEITDFGIVKFAAGGVTYINGSGSTYGLPTTCFLKGTQVLMADGSYKNIEDIDINDFVKSFNIKSGKIVNRQVIKVYHHNANEMSDYYLVINDFLKVTPEHRIYNDGKWIYFENLEVGDKINDIEIYSIDAVFEKMQTFDLEIEKDHNYFVKLYDEDIIVHNADPPIIIDSSPWVLTSKEIYPDTDKFLPPYGDDYYVEYSDLSVITEKIFEVKKKTCFPYAVLDIDKISKLEEKAGDSNFYSTAKSSLGFSDVKYVVYNFNIEIRDAAGNVTSYGVSYDVSGTIISSFSKNVLIYHPPEYDGVTISPPYYSQGCITVRVFFGGGY